MAIPLALLLWVLACRITSDDENVGPRAVRWLRTGAVVALLFQIVIYALL